MWIYIVTRYGNYGEVIEEVFLSKTSAEQFLEEHKGGFWCYELKEYFAKP